MRRSRSRFATAQGPVFASLPFVIYRGELRPRASALSRASVIAKDIGLEVVRAGRRERNVLIPRGMGLPTETKHVFFTADQSGAVVLRLLQGRLTIKTLAVQVSRASSQIGTAVELTLKCDEAMRMEARAMVAGQELWARLEPPEETKLDAAGAVEKLLEDAEQLKRGSWGREGAYLRGEIEALTAGIREVLATDPAKLQALGSRLRRLIEDYLGNPADPLQPSLEQFVREMNALRRIVYAAKMPLLGLDRDAWEARIRDVEERAEVAHAAVDTAAWRRIYNEVQALFETAHEEGFAQRRLDDPTYIRDRVTAVSSYRLRILRALEDFVPSTAPEIGPMQVKERDRLMAAIAERVDPVLAKIAAAEITVPADIRRTLDEATSEIDRVETAHARLPSLGLVTERGGGTPRGEA